MVSACSTRHQTGDTDSFQLVIPLPIQLDSQGTFVPCEARIVWYSAASTASRALRDTTQMDKNTVGDWLNRAALPCRSVALYFWGHLHVTECQLDELWGFVHTKEAHLPCAKLSCETSGDAWVW